MPPLNLAQPQAHMVPDCSRSGLVAPAARTSYLDPNGVPRRTPLASVGQAKFRARAQPGKDSVVKEAGLKEQYSGGILEACASPLSHTWGSLLSPCPDSGGR